MFIFNENIHQLIRVDLLTGVQRLISTSIGGGSRAMTYSNWYNKLYLSRNNDLLEINPVAANTDFIHKVAAGVPGNSVVFA